MASLIYHFHYSCPPPFVWLFRLFQHSHKKSTLIAFVHERTCSSFLKALLFLYFSSKRFCIYPPPPLQCSLSKSLLWSSFLVTISSVNSFDWIVEVSSIDRWWSWVVLMDSHCHSGIMQSGKVIFSECFANTIFYVCLCWLVSCPTRLSWSG